MGDRTNDLNALRKNARRCEANDDIDGALSSWSRLAELIDDGEAFERLGVLAMRRGDHGEAFRLLKKAAELTPARAKTRVLLARAADEAATPEEALEAWSVASRMEPTVEAHFRMGAISGELGREEEAISHFEQAWAADPGKVKPLRSLARVHELRADYDKAAEVWLRAVEGDERHEAFANLGRLLANSGDYEQALNYLEQALAGGDDAQVLRRVALIQEKLGLADRGESALRRAIRAKDEAISHDRLGVLLRDQGRFDEAIAEFRNASALEPNVRRYFVQIARLCEKLGRLNDAVAAWESVVAFTPDEASYQRLAVLQLKLNRSADAVASLQKSAKLTGESVESWRRIACALEDADEPEAAARAWRRALDMAPADTMAKRRLSQLYYSEDLYEELGDGQPQRGAGPTRTVGEGLLARFGGAFRRGNIETAGASPFRNGARESAVVDEVRRELDRLALDDRPILVGPWLSELGFELLYWIPFLTWAVRRGNLAPERIIVMSRGGMRPLYESLGKTVKYLEIYDLVSTDEFREINRRRWLETGLQKHLFASEADRALLRKFGIGEDHHLLHPKIMYMLLASFWAGRTGFRRYKSHVELTRMRPIAHPILDRLPKSFVAAKFYSRPSFENSPENSERLRRFVGRLAEKSPVVLLNTGLSPDEHGEFAFDARDNVFFINEAVSPAENLHAQAAIVSHASHLYCTYGGFAYLPLYFGGSVTSYYSGDRHYLHMHSPAAYWMAEKVGARLSVCDADALGG